MRGRVASLNRERRFGFIEDDEGNQYFFHQSGLQRTAFEELTEGTPVVFEVSSEHGDQSGERPRAVNLTLAEDAVPAVDNEPLPPGKVNP